MGSEKKDLKWLRIASVMAQELSTCSRRQYAAILLSKNGRQIGSGYNGSAPGSVHCNDGGCPRANSDSAHGSVYDNCIAIHAEANALVHSDYSMLEGGTLIVNGPPCYGCAKLIATSGIRKVVCQNDPHYSNFPEIVGYLRSFNIEVNVYDLEHQ